MRHFLIVPAATLALVCGCGESTPDPNDPSSQNMYGQYTPPANTAAPPPGGYTQPTTTATTTAPTNPGMPGTTGAATGSPATPIAVPAAAALQPLLTQLAAGEVQGMQPDGAPFAGNFQEGQVLEQQFTIQAGKCYSVVGASMGVQELDVQLVFHPAPLPPQVLAQDNTQGGTAVLGGKSSGCFKNALPVGGPGKIIMKATRGAGLAMAQIYIK
ncbi:MAG: hypothetical protein IPM54_35955 [Polyangiaceae bacterium]|nr:hypothetical protein [Polyangiaceae bacterium]